MNRNKQEYINRIHRVLEYIDKHPGRKLSLEELAEISCFSPFYFHRIFHTLMGETVHSYLLGRKLSGAANALLCDINKSVTEIALEYGFTSSSDFSRAFKRFFKVTPGRFRLVKQGQLHAVTRDDYIIKINNTISSTAINRELEEKIKIVELKNVHVAYIFCTGLVKNFFTPGVLKAYKRLKGWLQLAGLFSEKTRFLGIYYDNPEIIPLHKCRYDTCVTVPEGTVPPAGISTKTLPLAGKFICYRYNRSEKDFSKKVAEVMKYLIKYWFPTHGFVLDNRPGVEIYSRGAKKDILVDLHLAIKSL